MEKSRNFVFEFLWEPLQVTKVLFRICGCTDWPAPLLFICNKVRFSGNEAHLLAHLSRRLISELIVYQ